MTHTMWQVAKWPHNQCTHTAHINMVHANALVIPQNAPQSAIEELDESALEIHQRSMDCLDDVITAFMKLKDVEGIHEAAR